jgi:hypothetical protein
MAVPTTIAIPATIGIASTIAVSTTITVGVRSIDGGPADTAVRATDHGNVLDI